MRLRHAESALMCASIFAFTVWATFSASSAAAEPSGVVIAFEPGAPYYEPQQAVVSARLPVRWINSTASSHSVRHDGCLTDEFCAFHSIAIPPDSSFQIAPLPPGRYAYHCELHPIMRGTLIVVEPSNSNDGRPAAAFAR